MKRLLGILICFVLITSSFSFVIALEGIDIQNGLDQTQNPLRLLSSDLNNLVDADRPDEPYDSVDKDHPNEPNDSVEHDYLDDINDFDNKNLQENTEKYEILFIGKDMDEIDWNNIPSNAIVEYSGETEEIRILLPTKISRAAFGEELYSPPYIPDGMKVSNDPDEPEITTRAIIGTDDRQKITNCQAFPYSAMCYIEVVYKNGRKAYGTGTMVAKNCLVTAAHLAYNLEWGGYPERMYTTPGGPVVRRADPYSILGITTCDLHSYSNGQLVKVINGGINFRAHALSYIRNVIDKVADDY